MQLEALASGPGLHPLVKVRLHVEIIVWLNTVYRVECNVLLIMNCRVFAIGRSAKTEHAHAISHALHSCNSKCNQLSIKQPDIWCITHFTF